MAAITVHDINAMIEREFPGTGNSCFEIGADFAVARHAIDAAALRPGGFVSGPTQFSLADAVLWYAVFVGIQRIEPMAMTSELSIRYLRPAVGTTLWAKATIEKAGRRNVVSSFRVWCDDRDDKPTATGQGTYALPT